MRRLYLAAALVAALAAFPALAATTLRFGHANDTGEIATDLFQEFADNVTKTHQGRGHDPRVSRRAARQGSRPGAAGQVGRARHLGAVDGRCCRAWCRRIEIASAPFLWNDWARGRDGHPRPGVRAAVRRALRDKHNIADAVEDLVLGLAQPHHRRPRRC